MNNPIAGFTLIDHDKEKSAVSFGVYPITALNLPTFLTDWGALRTALGNVTVGTIGTERAQVFNTVLSVSPATNPVAQRESKWLVRGYDERQFLDALNTITNPNYQKVFTFEIPCADLTLLQPNSKEMDIAAGAGLAFVTELEKVWRSPSDGQMRVIDVIHVGRNN